MLSELKAEKCGLLFVSDAGSNAVGSTGNCIVVLLDAGGSFPMFSVGDPSADKSAGVFARLLLSMSIFAEPLSERCPVDTGKEFLCRRLPTRVCLLLDLMPGRKI